MRAILRQLKVLAMTSALVAAFPAGALGNERGTPMLVGQRHSIPSSALSEQREIIVHLPPGYARSKRHYPVMIVLDGEPNTPYVAGLVDLLSRIERIPEMIVIGIPAMGHRIRDLTPSATDPDTVAEMQAFEIGRADAFIRFLADDVMAWVDRRYRTAPYRILTGHSLGGLVAMRALQNRPEAFSAIIAASPSLWWDGQAPVVEAAARLPTLPGRHFLFMSWGDHEPRIADTTSALAARLAASPPMALQWQAKHYPGETHGSTPARTLYDGLTLLYAGWRPEAAVTGEPDKSEDYARQLTTHAQARSERYGYPIPLQPRERQALVDWRLARGELREALAAAQDNLRSFPEQRRSYWQLAEVLRASGRPADALPYYRHAARIPTAYDDQTNDLRIIGAVEAEIDLAKRRKPQ